MIDFHSHILPGIDDGAQSVEMSLNMLSESYNQGVRTIIATPHCYINKETQFEKYNAGRLQSFKRLKEAIENNPGNYPQIKLGCELRVMDEITDAKVLKPLCIENTNYILVEMPYKKWSMSHYDFLYALLLNGMRPVMAHIERFRAYKNEFGNLFSLDLLYQVNADAFISNAMKRFMPYLFEHGAAQVIGSDMHNVTSRTSHMKEAQKAVARGYGQARWDYMQDNAGLILENKQIEPVAFPKMGFLEKLKL